ncbi:sensor histidine kinase [Anaerotalea alkaliphila]|uniref:histidine kinase n=1 Tax=Anaerotalea alkaliphila TaxID=2662126 RepID=A0A7X5HW98_9FIRM|nr:DUF4118 domain-containing protein [Anaerotalea alkaliphila]NDL67823.1 DUF4118 domain-containing protein [Anaerotalea alkaliphila]
MEQTRMNGLNETLLGPRFLRDLGKTLLAMALAAGAGLLFRQFRLFEAEIILLFLLGVLAVARITEGYLCGILAAFLGVGLFNFLFTEPYLSLAVYRTEYFATFLVMLATALLTSTSTSRIRKEARQAEQRERTIQELYARQREATLLAESERLRGNLLRSISHDLRTPLAGILGSVSTILENYQNLPDSVKKELLQDVFQDTGWLSQTMDNILSMTRLEEGELLLNRKEELAEEVIAASIARVNRFLGPHTFRILLPEEMLTVWADPQLLEQVLGNLLENALRHSGPRSRILLLARKQGQDILFRVEDDGPGFPPEDLSRVFDRFYSNPRTGSPEHRGIGLGLSICRSIVLAHGGTIDAGNRRSGGAWVAFTIPPASPVPQPPPFPS